MKCERCDGHGEVNLDQVGAGAWVVCKNCNGKGVYPAREAKLIVAVRKLRDAWVRGDDKCWKDLVELFQVLPEGFTPPASDTLVELANCEKYIKSCHHPDTVYVSPQRRIEELEAENARLKQELLIREVERGPIK